MHENNESKVSDIYPENNESKISHIYTNSEKEIAMIKAILLGLLIPILIAVFITLSRYWTLYYGYSSIDFTLDNYLVIGILEIGFFIYFY